jgi:hypothetical protein
VQDVKKEKEVEVLANKDITNLDFEPTEFDRLRRLPGGSVALSG